MYEIIEGIYLGNSQDAHWPKDIRTILNCAFDLDIRYDPAHFLCARIGLMDGPGNVPLTYVVAADCLESLRVAGGKVLVHCHEGRSRSPSVIICWLMRWRGYALDKGIDLIRTKMGFPQGVVIPREWHIDVLRKLGETDGFWLSAKHNERLGRGSTSLSV